MTGKELKMWVEKAGLRPERLAADLDVSLAAINKWFLTEVVPLRHILALKQAGFLYDLEEKDDETKKSKKSKKAM